MMKRQIVCGWDCILVELTSWTLRPDVFLSIGKWKATRKVYLPILCVTSFLIKIVWSLPRNRESVCFRVLPANADSCFSRTRRGNSFVWWPIWNLIKTVSYGWL